MRHTSAAARMWLVWVVSLTGCAMATPATAPTPAAAPATDSQGPMIRGRVRVGFNPVGVVVTPDGAFVYVANTTSNYISKIATDSMTVISNISIATSPVWMALAPKKGLLCVTSRDGHALVLFDIQANYQVATIDLPYSPEQVAVNPDGTLAYITNSRAPFVTVVDLEKRRIVQNISVNGNNFGLAVTPDGKRLCVTTDNANFNVQVISLADNTLAGRGNAGTAAGSVKIDPAGLYAYVANHDSNDITVIHLPTCHAVMTIPVCQNPMDLSLTPSGRYLYVTCNFNQLMVVDTATQKSVAALGLGVSPYGLAFSPDGRTAYVANYEASNVQNIYDVSRPDATMGTGSAQRLNNNTLLLVDTGKFR